MAEFKISRIKYTWKGEWSSGDTYYIDNIVSYGGNVYVCLEVHNSESGGGFYNDLNATIPNTVPPASAPRWEKMMEGYAWTGDWQANIPYSQNDLVKYGGTVYRCITQHTSESLIGIDSTLVVDYGLENDQSNWQILARTEDWKTDWIINTPYRVHDIVKYGATIYRCITAHISAQNYSNGLEEHIANWQVVHSGVEYTGVWTTSTRYKVNDIVKYGARAYICTTAHSTSGQFDISKFSVYAPGLEYDDNWQSGVSYTIGDVVKYGGYAYTAITNNQTSIPSTQTSDWELLSLGYNLRGDYNSSTSYRIGDVIRRNGILYACIADSTGYDPTDIAYWEPVVSSFKWRNIWSTAQSYELNDIATFDLFAYRCIQRHTSSPLLRPDLSGGLSYWSLYSEGDLNNTLRSLGDMKVFGVGEDGSTIESTRFPIGSAGQVLKTKDQLNAWEYFSEITKVYYVSVEGIDNASRGTTLDSPWRTVKYACENITGPATIFIKTGYYEEIIPISIPASVALVGDELRGTTISPASGYEQEDMFYVRNGSGIRNMTLTGLSGTLGALNQYLTRRPSAGAYVSLDPGTSTNDSSVWITSRSPYIQNVTTFGTGCVGLKIDGNLHDGGNRSIVANDFTQVLSDGIGAWVTNQGLTELVSVFTYYNHIGYLAENGGKIRGTNGNCSYGTFGAVSEGVSLAEVPITGTVDNRTGEATVAAALSGQSGEQILILEYDHCGQDYVFGSTAFTITGAGTGAIAIPTVKNGAVSNIRVKTPGDSTSAGGFGYLNVINNAQAGDNLTITLSSSDTNLPINYETMRIVIISGTGTGQYGYIQDYDDVTKIATVYKESDDTPGWDHVAGLSIHALLDTTTQYSIEPRVIFSAAPLGGVTALGRVEISQQRISRVKIWDCGEGYVSTPTLTIVDPNNTAEVVTEVFRNNGVLGPVTWTSRGNGYQTTSTTVTITGIGFAEKFQLGSTLYLQNVSFLPGPGDNLTISQINDVIYKIVQSEVISGISPSLTIRLRIFPELGIEESPTHTTPIIVRQKYSQVRLTGHDFLDIGVGNFNNTDYPVLYKDNNFVAAPENEVYEVGGGRVFYTSTDQDGNFRVGELFKVEQATGTVTISATLFSLSGLEELQIGGVSVGGTGTVIREFSTDSNFTADSNNIVPTQKAIKAYLTSRISGGGSDAFTTILTAGTVVVGPNLISSTVAPLPVNVDVAIKFNAPLAGYGLSMAYFANTWDSDIDYTG